MAVQAISCDLREVESVRPAAGPHTRQAQVMHLLPYIGDMTLVRRTGPVLRTCSFFMGDLPPFCN
jgi:hypothetical protein